MISLLFAMDKNRLIGKDNDLPWYLPADLKYFKQVTMGHTILMGRKTFQSIGKALPGRKNIVLTRDKAFKADGCDIIYSLDQLNLNDQEELFVIGGAEIYKLALPLADRLYITFIDQAFEGDAYFPEIDYNEWKEIKRVQGRKDEKNPYDYFYTIFERKK